MAFGNSTRREALIYGLAATTVAATGRVGTAFGQANSPIQIGHLSALSGPNGTAGLADGAGIRAAQAELNAAGGLLGRPVEIVARDTVGDPGKAVNFAQELLFNVKVDALFGTNSSAETFPVRKVSKDAGTIEITDAQIDAIIDPKEFPQLYRCFGSTGDQLDVMVGYLIDTLKKTKVAILVDNLSYGLLSRDIAIAKMAARQAKPVYVGVVEQTKTDMTDDITKVRNTGADAVLVLTASSGFIARILTARGEQKWEVPTVVSPLVLSSQVTQLLKPAYMDGVLGIGFRHLVNDSQGKFAPMAQAMLDRHAAIVEPYLKNGITWIFYGYSTVMLWAKGVEVAKSTKLADVSAALEKIGTFETPFGKMIFKPGQRDVLDLHELTLLYPNSEHDYGFKSI